MHEFSYTPLMLLAGDVGGTKTLLGLFTRAPERPRPLATERFTTLDFGGLGEMVREFLGRHRAPGRQIEAACFGVAGPVRGHTVQLTNVPWRVDAVEVAERVGLPRIDLLNDLEAMALAVPLLNPGELAVLQEGQASETGNAAVIAAGTGLGEAMLHNIDGRFVPFPSEGGHADFAPRTPREIAVAQELTRVYGRVDCERVISGPGLVNIYRFVHRNGCDAVDAQAAAADLPPLITAAALERRCPRCVETLELFVEAYGAEAGNLALRAVATAGVYVGGGIARHIVPTLERGPFLEAFRSKEPMVDLLAAIPVSVILNPQAALLGAAVRANSRLA